MIHSSSCQVKVKAYDILYMLESRKKSFTGIEATFQLPQAALICSTANYDIIFYTL